MIPGSWAAFPFSRAGGARLQVVGLALCKGPPKGGTQFANCLGCCMPPPGCHTVRVLLACCCWRLFSVKPQLADVHIFLCSHTSHDFVLVLAYDPGSCFGFLFTLQCFATVPFFMLSCAVSPISLDPAFAGFLLLPPPLFLLLSVAASKCLGLMGLPLAPLTTSEEDIVLVRQRHASQDGALAHCRARGVWSILGSRSHRPNRSNW
mmetsp:Transcript_2110/g.4823  ORF Transcript_2110/g.4823 Transcript_2110/m.4823 type:complete len:206 (+) Transcript_2110:2-619(+)